MRGMQRALSLIYPCQCILCPAFVDAPGGLCPDCWRQTPFVKGLVCDACGTPLPGQGDGTTDHCDDCLAMPRPWERGRAALGYRDLGRRVVLALKHADRTDLAASAAMWMRDAGRPLLTTGTLLVPVPIHWTRLLTRRYNQSSELARHLGRLTGLAPCHDALRRVRRTRIQDGMNVEQRLANLADAIRPNPARAGVMRDSAVCLIDDVMTSGATLAEATRACHAAGAGRVSVLVLARVGKTP